MSWEVNIISKKSSSNTQDKEVLGVFLLPERRTMINKHGRKT